jgi:hypothetical protein
VAIAKILTNSSASVAAPATLTVTKPTGGTPGAADRLVLVVTGGNGGGNVGSYTAPAGWTSVGSVLNLAGGAGHTSLQVWHAAGDVASLGFTKSGTVADAGWVMLCFSGCDTTTPVDVAGTANSATGANSLATNALTVVTDQAWHLIGFADWLSGTYSATGFTVAASPTTNEACALLYNTTPKGVGSTGAVTVNDSASATNQNLMAVPFALRPAAAASTPTGFWPPPSEPLARRGGVVAYLLPFAGPSREVRRRRPRSRLEREFHGATLLRHRH